MKKIISLFTLLLLYTPMTMAATGSSLYEIEALVFQNLRDDLEGEELWINNKIDEPTSEADEPRVAVRGRETQQDSRLTKAAEVMTDHGGYRILAHTRWFQGAEAKSKARQLVLTGKNDKTQLEGGMRFYLGRFFHITMDLQLKEASKHLLPFNPEKDPESIIYRIKQGMRIKTKEINYFDHPKFGVLVQVKPVRRR